MMITANDGTLIHSTGTSVICSSPTTPMSGLPPPVRLISHARFLIFSALIYDLILYQYICLLCLIRIFTLISYSYVIPE